MRLTRACNIFPFSSTACSSSSYLCPSCPSYLCPPYPSCLSCPSSLSSWSSISSILGKSKKRKYIQVWKARSCSWHYRVSALLGVTTWLSLAFLASLSLAVRTHSLPRESLRWLSFRTPRASWTTATICASSLCVCWLILQNLRRSTFQLLPVSTCWKKNTMQTVTTRRSP